jgi:hypothetical protein
MEIKEVVYCNLYDWQLKQIEEKLCGVDAEIVKGIVRMTKESVQEAFDKGRKFEKAKLDT